MRGVAIRLADLMPMPAAVVAPRRVGGEVVDFEIVDSNAAADPVFRAGVPGSAVGNTLRQLMPWIEEAGVWQIYMDVLVTGTPVTRRDFELCIPGDDARTMWDITAMPLGDRVLVFFTDISDDWRRYRQRSEKRVQITKSEERSRVARDLHDSVVQEVIAASMGLARLASTMEPQVAAELDAIIAVHDSVIKHLRTALFDLRTARRDLDAEIAEVVVQAEVSLGFAPTLTLGSLEGARDGNVIGDHVLHIVREALSNVARHAHAHHVHIDVREDAGWLTLSVIDDGVGIRPSAPRGVGLDSMETRTRMLGGMAFVEPASGGGTRVVCELPVDLAVIDAAAAVALHGRG